MNKKKLFGSIAVLAIAAMAAFNVNVNTNETGLGDTSLLNIEALASESTPVESLPGGCNATWDKTCCACGSTHYTYAKSNGGSCTTVTGCHVYN